MNKDDFLTKTKCDRCGGSLDRGRMMSVYNQDCLCMNCKEKEKTFPDYEAAHTAEHNAILRGDYNFPGIGLPEERKEKGLQVLQTDGKDYDILLIRENGETITLKWNEFWAICREGNRIDSTEEVEEYLSQCDEIDGIELNDTVLTPEIIAEIAETVSDIRVENESGDDVYEAARCILNKHFKNKKENK